MAGVPIPRRDASFEFSESEQVSSRFQSLNGWLKDLTRYFRNVRTIEEMDLLIENELTKQVLSGTIKGLPFVQLVLTEQHRCLELMKNIRCFLLERLRTNSPVNKSTDNWDSLSKDFNIESYVFFCYTLIRLVDVDYDRFHRLSFTAGRMYMVLLGSPGAKRCNVFDPSIILSYFKLFDHLERAYSSKSSTDLNFQQLQFQSMLEESRIVFNLVSLKDQDEVKKLYVDTLAKILKLNVIQGYKNKYAYEITMSSYENLDSLCLGLHSVETPEETIFLIFCRTFELHLLSQRRSSIPIPGNQKHGDNIVDFFIYLLEYHTDETKNVIIRFIKSFISNPDQYRKDDIPILLTNSVKYELTLFSKYNDLSIVEYAIELAYAQDFQQRTSAVEFLSKILVTESRARQGGDDPVTDHREQKVLEILILKTIDKKDGVKLKALNGLQKAFSEGNAYTQRLLNATFDKNSDNDAFLLVGRLSRESIKKLIFTLIHLAQTNKSPYVRKSSIALLDVIGRRDESLIQNEDLARLVSTLPDDTSILVRSQTIEMLTGWLEKYPTNRKLLELWVDVILSLLEDDEARIKASAMKSLFSNVFTKIVAYEDSVSYASYTPWIIIQTIIEKDRRDVLINAIETSKPDALTANKIRIIENHIYSSKCTEGFVLLSVISGKVKSSNSNTLIKIFLELATECNMDPVKLKLILEVAKDWINDFSEGSLRQLLAYLTKMLEDGTANLSLISSVYMVCRAARQRFQLPVDLWVDQINETSKEYLLNNMNGFRLECDERFVNYLLIYCETITDLSKEPNPQLLEMLVNYLKDAVNGKCSMSIQTDGLRKLNLIVEILARFALRDSDIACDITPNLGALLRRQTQMTTVNPITKCLSDLCKKHTSFVEPVLKEVVHKLTSKNDAVRLCALENLYELVMQDYIRLRGRVLLHILACIVDPNEAIQMKAVAAILNYANDKNSNILHTSFLECAMIFNECTDYQNQNLFPSNELDRTRILYGPANEERRHQLYQFLTHNIFVLNEFQILVLFKHIVSFNIKLARKEMIRSENGVQAMKDILKIFVIICKKRQESKSKPLEKSESNEVEETMSRTVSNKKENLEEVGTRVVETMITAFPHFVERITEYDQSLSAGVQELGFAIAKTFPELVKFATPDSFWNKFRNKASEKASRASTSGKGRKRTKKNEGSSDESSEEDVSDDDLVL